MTLLYFAHPHQSHIPPSSPLQPPKTRQQAASTQTSVDDDGLWDVSMGWTLPMSRTVEARNRWRRAYKFAKCPSCRGVGGYVAKAVALYHNLVGAVGSRLRETAERARQEEQEEEWQQYQLRTIEDPDERRSSLLAVDGALRRKSVVDQKAADKAAGRGPGGGDDKDGKDRPSRGGKRGANAGPTTLHNILVDTKYVPLLVHPDKTAPSLLIPPSFLPHPPPPQP